MDYMTTQRIGKIAGSAVLGGALLLSGAGLAFAQSYGTTGSTGSSGTGASAASPTTNTSGTAGSATTNSSSGTTGSSSTTPGVPNTGAGGDAAANLAVLGASAIVVAGGAAYLASRRYALR
jgi:hypothetical protein